jgi:hypothetical protein
MLSADAGNGDKLLRMHFDGKMYQLLGNWLGRFAAVAPAGSQAQVQRQVALFTQMGKMVQSGDIDVKLDDKGLRVETAVKHR